MPSTYLIRSYPNSSEINLGHHEGKFEDASMRGSSAATLKEIIFAPWMEDTVGSNFSHWKKKKILLVKVLYFDTVHSICKNGRVLRADYTYIYI